MGRKDEKYTTKYNDSNNNNSNKNNNNNMINIKAFRLTSKIGTSKTEWKNYELLYKMARQLER